MRTRIDPASVVICAELPGHVSGAARGAAVSVAARRGCPITWAGEPEALASAVAVVPGDAVALTISPAWLDSRRTLRERIASARAAAPGLAAALLGGPRPLEHHALLAEEGIRVVIVDVFGAAPHGSRRPAPSGWDCRNPVWGLWEVRVTPQSAHGPWRWLNGPLSRPRPGSLRVLLAGRVQPGPTGAVSTRLERFSAWAERRQSGNSIRVVTPADLAAHLDRGGDAALAGSVLRAA